MALAAGYISVFSFLGLAWLIGESNAQMERVVVADQVAAVCLLIALPVFLISRRKA
jgi:4-amino-4-deoxy-L-arabinose transferase-like glycosyltransferase